MADFDRMRAFFGNWVAANGNRGPVGEIAQCLADGELGLDAYYDIVARHGIAREPWARDGLIDLVIAYSKDRFANGVPAVADLTDIRRLRTTLRIRDAAMIERRPVEIAGLLLPVFEAVFAKEAFGDSEERYLVEVQAAFGLGYDELLMLARPALAAVIAVLRSHVEHRAELAPVHNAGIRKLAALEPLYQLARRRPRSRGAIHRPGALVDAPSLADLRADSAEM